MKDIWTTTRLDDSMFVEVGPDDDDGVISGSITFVEVGPDDDDGLHPAR